MKFDFRKFFAFGLLVSLCYLILAGIILYFAPNSNSISTQSWIFLGIPLISWKTQFVFSLFFLVIFLILLLLTVNWKSIKLFIKKEFPNKISNSKELWISIVFVLIILTMSGLEISWVQNLANVSQSDIVVPDETPESNYNSQQNYNSEKDSEANRLLKNKTINEVISEIGITKLEALTIFSKTDIKHTGNFDVSMQIISDENKVLPTDIYSILSGKKHQLTIREPQQKKKNQQKKQENKKLSDFDKMAKSKTINEIADIIKEQQPDAEISQNGIIDRLKKNKIKLAGENETIGQIASNNKVSIDVLMQIIAFGQPKSVPPVPGAQRMDGPPKHIKDNQIKARQIMQTSIKKLAIEYQLNEGDLLNALENKGYKATKNQTIEDVAKANNEQNAAVLKVLRKEKKRQRNLKSKK